MATSQMTLGMKLEGHAVREQLDSFTAWWTGELQVLMPSAWRERVGRGTRRLLVDVDGHQARISLRSSDGARELGVLDVDGELRAQPEMEAALRAAAKEPLHEIVVRVPQRQALIRTLSFPVAAEENLREVIAFEMDRHTPFKAEQVYYDYTIARRGSDKSAISVLLVVIPRSAVDPLLDTLTGADLAPTSLTIGGASQSVQAQLRTMELLPLARRQPVRSDGRRSRQALATLALVLLLVAVALPLVDKHRRVRALQAQVQVARAEALRAEQVRKEFEQLLAASNALAVQRKAHPLAIALLDEVTRILPDSTWLTRLELNGSKVKLQGESANASEVATLILASELFADARFDSPVTRVGTSQRERFLISATITGAPVK
jgi:general secretion pathway protein L